LDTCKFLENVGFKLTYLRPDIDGRFSLDCILDALTDETILVSMMHVNNETGVIQNIDLIAEALKDKGGEICSRSIDHPVLGSRLRECTQLVNQIDVSITIQKFPPITIEYFPV